jgi:RNA ligase (TIGR02306 family)
MSEFSVPVKTITIEPHPDPEVHSLQVGIIDGYKLIVRKDDYKSGDLIVYIPEQAIVPDAILDQVGLRGSLSGPNKNVVKALKIRQIVSQGLAYRPAEWPEHWVEGYDVATELGIEKYEQPIPASLRGNVERGPQGLGVQTLTYTDIDNIKKNLNKIAEGEPVVMTEKIHGTCSIVVRTKDGRTFVSSKGQAGKWLVIREEAKNVYWRAVKDFNLEAKLDSIIEATGEDTAILYGEVFGPGVQDLTYGVPNGQLGYAAFDLKLKSQDYVDYSVFATFAGLLDIPRVPEVYVGPYSDTLLEQCTKGNTTVKGATHVREGVVVKPLKERTDYRGNRVVYKSINDAYLLRKNATEFN